MQGRITKLPGFNPLHVVLFLGALLLAALACVETTQSSEPPAGTPRAASCCEACHTLLQPSEQLDDVPFCFDCAPLLQLATPDVGRSHVSIANLIARNASLAINPHHGHAQELAYNPPDGGDPVTFDGIFDETDANGELQKNAHGEKTMRQALVEVPTSLGVSEKGTFTVYGKNWKILGLVGRDANLETWRAQLPQHGKVRKPLSNL